MCQLVWVQAEIISSDDYMFFIATLSLLLCNLRNVPSLPDPRLHDEDEWGKQAPRFREY